jgi:ABC-type nitrate/sulfonate/bicarbonate transport system substrate-binding protein
MGWIAQAPRRISGVDYQPGDPVPDSAVNEGVGSQVLVALGVISYVPDAAVAGIQAGQPATVAAFDPAEHTVADVLAYLDANPDQAERVMEQEQDGKARKTLLDAIEERLTEPEETG